MPVYIDQLGREVVLQAVPQRIVSLVPSQTELLADLGLENEVVGITKFCVHPREWFRSKKRIGGTKNIHIEAVRSLRPDLVLANKEENVQEQVEALAAEFPVWTSAIGGLDASLAMIRSVGTLTGRAQRGANIAARIRRAFDGLKNTAPPIPAAYLIWKDPMMTVGGDTFISEMLSRAGFRNVFADRERYPAVTPAAILHSGCRVLLLSSEPFPFTEKHVRELAQQLPGVAIRLVDGELFSWYGSRLLHAPAYFKGLRAEAFA